MRLFHPEVFQGRLTSKRYFEGWYFKHVSADLSRVYSFIPGVALNSNHPHAFIQVINRTTGNTHYIEYPLSEFKFRRDNFWVKVGKSEFSAESMHLDIEGSDIKVKGRLNYSGRVKYPFSWFSPGIMGWYSFVPFMECKHGVVSVNHHINGFLHINEEPIDFAGGKGYIEKDWGRSFPEAWIWLQSNNFDHADASIMISIANIPWLGNNFTGFLGFMYADGQFYPFSTYNGSRIQTCELTPEGLVISIRHQNYILSINATLNRAGVLKAPQSGNMDRHIKESIDSELKVLLKTIEGKIIFKGTGHRAGLEVIEGIFAMV